MQRTSSGKCIQLRYAWRVHTIEISLDAGSAENYAGALTSPHSSLAFNGS